MSTQQQRVLKIRDVQQVLGGISKGTVESLAKQGEFTLVHVGKRLMITADSLEAYLDRISQKGRAG